ncbi:MAG: FtsQ-type POTRA domain-containing protein [Candidatus Gracilibacteria bacterium]|nr:FtsQ-type POTRA domain-containing protein [Candidatus Gracilibacteria bacterium]
MFNKIFNIFKGKKTRFRETIKKEKRRFYMFDKRKSSTFFSKRKKNIFQLKINYNFNKKIFYIFLLSGILISIIGIVYILKGGYFSIQNINIIINDKITDENIAYKSLDLIRGKSIFLENKGTIYKKLMDYQKNINNIEVNRVLPNILNIYIDSYPIIMDIYYNSKLYSLTSNGVLIPFKAINKDKERIILKIITTKENKYKILSYKKIFEDELIKQVYLLINSFKDNILEHPIEKILLYKDENELHIVTKNKTIFIFYISENIEKQIKKLIVYSKEKEKNLKFIYVDLRIEDKIFVCPYEKEYQCLKNYKRIYNKKQ